MNNTHNPLHNPEFLNALMELVRDKNHHCLYGYNRTWTLEEIARDMYESCVSETAEKLGMDIESAHAGIPADDEAGIIDYLIYKL